METYGLDGIVLIKKYTTSLILSRNLHNSTLLSSSKRCYRFIQVQKCHIFCSFFSDCRCNEFYTHWWSCKRQHGGSKRNAVEKEILKSNVYLGFFCYFLPLLVNFNIVTSEALLHSIRSNNRSLVDTIDT